MNDKEVRSRLVSLTDKPDERIGFLGYPFEEMSKETLMVFVRWLVQEYEKRGVAI